MAGLFVPFLDSLNGTYTNKNSLVAKVSYTELQALGVPSGKSLLLMFLGTSTTLHDSANCITFRFWALKPNKN